MVRPGGTPLFGQNGYQIENFDILFFLRTGEPWVTEKKRQSREAKKQQTRPMYGVAFEI